MPITDLLDRIPFSPGETDTDAPAPDRPFHVEALEGDGTDLGYPALPLPTEAPAPPPPSVPPMPSWGIVLVGGLTLLCATLFLALLAQPAAPPSEAEPAQAAAAPAPPSVPEASFASDPTPIPVGLLTRLEAASEEPLDVELARLLDAMQHGFGRRSAILEPTLRSYVFRMAARFEWNPSSFRIAVTAPDPDLAAARGALLERLFEDAVAAGRLAVGTGVGPHALTLVAEPSATE